MSTREFQIALANGDLTGLAAIPKSDLHNHSILGTRIECIESWLGHPLPHPSSRMTCLDDMISYAKDVLYPHILSREGFEFTARSAVQNAIDDGVSILEMSLDVRFLSLFDPIPDGYFSFISDLVKDFEEKIDFRPEIGMSKDRSAPDQARLASLCIRTGLFYSVDLYGNETAQHPAPFSGVYSEARDHGLKLKVHAGEFAGPEIIIETLDTLRPDEIQHGVTAATSESLMERLQRDHIRLNVCPSSNVALGVVRDIAHHPIRILFDRGVPVTINSDDLTIFGQSVSQEYLLLFKSGLFTADELDTIRLEGLSS